MQDSPPRVASDPDRFSAGIAEFRRQKAATTDQRKEIGILIKQVATEIDRLAQRNREISYQMRQLEANIEGVPRAEIKRRYSEAQEAQMRLFMMQSQLEQLRNRQVGLEATEELLDRVLELADSFPSPPVEGALLDAADTGGAVAPAQPPGGGMVAALPSIELANHRLSHQLQDGTAQALSDLILRAEVCERLVEMDRQKAREEIARLRSAASAALKSVRQLVHELQPPALEELGLVAALRRYVEASRAGQKLQLGFHVAGQERRLPEGVELAVFRIVQEALANAAQHSGADRAEVVLRFEAGQLVATVADTGRGFEVATAVAQAGLRDHSGLADMQLRAGLVGGAVEISSKPGAGCMISLAISV